MPNPSTPEGEQAAVLSPKDVVACANTLSNQIQYTENDNPAHLFISFDDIIGDLETQPSDVQKLNILLGGIQDHGVKNYCMNYRRKNINFSFNSFKLDFIKKYGSETKQEAWIEEFNTLTMGESTVREFAEKLQDVAIKAGLADDKTILQKFKANIREELKPAIRIMNPKTLERAVEIATIEESRLTPPAVFSNATHNRWKTYRRTCNICGRTNHTTNQCQSRCKYCRKTGHRHSECRKRMPQVHEIRRCFNCKEKGHIAKNCPLKGQPIQTDTIQTSAANTAAKRIDCLTVQVETSMGEKIQALVDTGSNANLIPRRLEKKFQLKNERRRRTTLSTSTSSQSVETTTATTEIKIGDKIKNIGIEVVPNLNHEMILGMPAMTAFKFNIDAKNRRIETSNTVVAEEYETPEIHQRFPMIQETTTLLHQYEDVFKRTSETANLPPVSLGIDETKVTEDFKTRKPNYSDLEVEFLKQWFKEALESGRCKVATETHRKPCFPIVVDKKNMEENLQRRFRMTVNFRPRNAQMKKNHQPTPSVSDITHEIAKRGFKYFSKLDWYDSYFQRKLLEADQPYTTTWTPLGFNVQFTVLPMGTSPSAALFQKDVTELFDTIPGTFSYIDDTTIGSKSAVEHIQALRRIFELAEKHNIRFNPRKSQIGFPKIKLLGFIVSQEGRQPDPERVKGLRSMQPPKSKAEVRSFAALARTFHEFIPHLSTLLDPINALTKKNKRFMWNDYLQENFELIKTKLSEEMLLANPDPNLPFQVVSDASNVAIAGALLQNDKPIMFFSRTLKDAEKNYSTTDKEGLAHVETLQDLGNFYTGKPSRRTPITNH